MLCLLIFLAIVVGGIPFGWLIAKMVKGIDLRHIGSGNIGATQVARELGKKWAAITFVMDSLKGFIPTYLAVILLTNLRPSLLVGVVAIFSHCFSPYLGGKGGKGVATALGVLLACQTPYALVAFGVWIILVTTLRYVSVASVSASLTLGALELIYQPDPLIKWPLFALALFIVLKHYSNIGRLIKGKEPKLSFGGNEHADH